jgi:hypothetical protein
MVKSLEPKKPRVLKDKTAPVKVAPATNQADAETFHFHLGSIIRKNATIAAHRKELKAIRRAAMDAGLSLADLDWAVRARELEPETVQADLKRRVQYAEWIGLAPPGTQGDLFKEGAAALDAELAAENDGYRAGIEGTGGPALEPERYDTASDIGQARLRGWNKGQAVLHERFLAKQPQQAETVQ